MLHRFITNSILSDLKYFPVIGILGPRQVGKTTLAKYIKETLTLDSIYLDLELDSDKRKFENAENFLTYHKDKCVIIDEVQRMPEIFPLLRALIDIDRRPARYILLGSASPNIIKGSSESLAGRISYHELTPFSLPEIENKISMEEHWLQGGFPESLLAENHEASQRWRKQFITTFIEMDIQQFGHQISAQLVRKLFIILGSISSNILNISDLSRSLGISKPSINKYLDLLEGGFIINRLYPYFPNVSKRMIKSPKVYIRDSGILHSLLNIHDYNQLVGNISLGASWEGYVIEQLKCTLGSDYMFYFYRTHKGAEADIVIICPNQEKICVEIKFSSNPSISRGFFETINDIKPKKSFVITPKGEAYPDTHNIFICGLQEFIKNKLWQD